MIFRKVALERLSSPEQLDQLMRVTNPAGWLALGAVMALLLGAVAWGFFGSIPSEARGEGILLRQGGVSDLEAAGSGQIREILVDVGAPVEKDQIVATIRQEGLTRQIDDVEAKRAAAEVAIQEQERYAAEQIRLLERNLAQKRANLERSITTLETQESLLDERIVAQRVLLDDGLITQQSLLETEQELYRVKDQAAAHRLTLSGLDLSRLEAEQQHRQQLETRRREMRDLELQKADLEASLAENVNVRSPHAGRVLEIRVNRGDLVNPGTPVLSMEIASDELMAVLYVPVAVAKQVRPGMPVQISPSSVRREEFGFMVGTVRWVSEYPSTSQGMSRLLGNEDLVSRLLRLGTPLQIDVALEGDPATPSGYRWSSSTGPDTEISSGTLIGGSVILSQERPVNLVVPKLRAAVRG